MNTIEYMDYQATVSYQDDVDMLMGQVINARDVITFYGKSVDELKAQMEASVKDYLALCAQQGIEPAKSYSGKFNVRLDPNLHKDLALTAHRKGVSLNKLITELLSEDIQQIDNMAS